MRMAKGFSDPPRRFAGEDPVQHRGRAGRGPKRAVNVSVDSKILKMAKEMKINLSQAFEDTSRERTKEEHKEAIEAHNRFIEENGIWSEEYRNW
jgi:antitoxin CcdA